MTPGWRLVGRNPDGRVVWLGAEILPLAVVAPAAAYLNAADRSPEWMAAQGAPADAVWSADPEPEHAPWCSCEWCTLGGPPNVTVTGV